MKLWVKQQKSSTYAVSGSFAEVLDNYFTLPDKPSDLAELKAG